MAAYVKWALSEEAQPPALSYGMLLPKTKMPPQGVAKVGYHFLSSVGRSPQRAVIQLSMGTLAVHVPDAKSTVSCEPDGVGILASSASVFHPGGQG
jgi:hypothetical protein